VRIKILLDCDGVVADFVRGACALHSRPNPYFEPTAQMDYSMRSLWKMQESEFYEGMEFDFWNELYKTKEADDIVQVCSDRVGRRNVCFLTKPTANAGCLEGKRSWLKKHYPGYPYLIGNDKSFCAGEGKILVDDTDANCDDFARHKGRIFLIPRAWNTGWQSETNIAERLDWALGTMEF